MHDLWKPPGLPGSDLQLRRPGNWLTTPERSVTLGRDVETGAEITVGDRERRSGLYVLGKPGMGKSALLVQIAQQDIKNGHGVFFLDPHGDAVEYLAKQHSLDKEIIFLDPTDETYAFGINPLACDDITKMTKREGAYKRIEGIFQRIWKDGFAESVWLMEIFQPTMRIFIEHQEYTLAEVLLFLNDIAFRRHILGKVKYETESLEFWENEFPKRQRTDQDRMLQSFRSRLNRLLGNKFVSHIISQRQTTVNFADIMAKQQIVLAKLPLTLSDEVKKFIGAIIMSELLNAIIQRPENNRPQFCIFVDEVQNFVSSDDFATLVTEARKFGIATTIAHQERYGQLEDNRKIAGATLAAVNKVLFQLTVRDAEELAPETAKEPPQEVRYERIPIPSQHPVQDLVEGHEDPLIHRFAQQYLRPMLEKLEDIRDEMAEERLIRMDFFDQAALFRIEASMAGGPGRLGSTNSFRSSVLGDAYAASAAGYERDQKLLSLHDTLVNTKWTLRAFNRFFTGIMEGTINPSPGEEPFAQFLINRVLAYNQLPEATLKLLELYIAIVYGDPSVPRVIPFSLAAAHQLYPSEVRSLIAEVNAKTEALQEECRKQWQQRQTNDRKWRHEDKEKALREARQRALTEAKVNWKEYARDRDIESWRTNFDGGVVWHPINVYMRYLWMVTYPKVQELLAPFRTARFADPIDVARLQSRVIYNLMPTRSSDVRSFHAYMHPNVISEIRQFFYDHNEAGYVMQWLLALAGVIGNPPDASYFRPIKGMDACDVFCVLKSINEYLYPLWQKTETDALFRAFRHAFRFPGENTERRQTSSLLQKIFAPQVADMVTENRTAELIAYVRQHGFSVQINPYPKLITVANLPFGQYTFKAVALLSNLSQGAVHYVLSKADCQSNFGEDYANELYPSTRYASLVRSLVALLEGTHSGQVATALAIEDENAKRSYEKRCAEELAKITVFPPAQLTPRVVTADMRNSVLRACLQELQQDSSTAEVTRKALAVIDDFVQFCRRLRHPENFVQRLSNQYKPVTRQSLPRREMRDAMADELSRLDYRVAYVKVMKIGGGEGVIMQKMQTLDLPPLPQGGTEFLRVDLRRRFAVDGSRARYYRERNAVEEEIRSRQARWRRPIAERTPSARKPGSASSPDVPPGMPDQTSGIEEPPPPTHS